MNKLQMPFATERFCGDGNIPDPDRSEESYTTAFYWSSTYASGGRGAYGFSARPSKNYISLSSSNSTYAYTVRCFKNTHTLKFDSQ